ncbi:MAG: GNAT family N-acetyltransferase [Chloroflexi bacterium]|nr:GNAT family N-acetyltransferase [Chloroflexota bacterium]
MHIERLGASAAHDVLDELVVLLRDAVDSGASIGFLPPLDAETARAYWEEICDDIAEHLRVLLVAREGNAIVGTVQLELARKLNARHRAEVQKLIVLTAARRRGIGRALLAAVEDEARREGRTLLVLDTREGDVAGQLYQAHGYAVAGRIPEYARAGDGVLYPTVIYYRLLEPANRP